MAIFSSIEVVNTSGLSDKAKFKLMKSLTLKSILTQKFKKKIMSKNLSKYIADSDYFDRTLIVLFATSGGVSIISFASVIGITAGIAGSSSTLVVSLAAIIIKKLLQITRNKKKKHNEIVVLAKSKLNSIEYLKH